MAGIYLSSYGRIKMSTNSLILVISGSGISVSWFWWDIQIHINETTNTHAHIHTRVLVKWIKSKWDLKFVLLSMYWIWFYNYYYASCHHWGKWVKGTQDHVVLFFITSSKSITIIICKGKENRGYIRLFVNLGRK